MSDSDPTNAVRQARRKRRLRNGILAAPHVEITESILEMLCDPDINLVPDERADDWAFIGQAASAFLLELAANWRKKK